MSGKRKESRWKVPPEEVSVVQARQTMIRILDAGTDAQKQALLGVVGGWINSGLGMDFEKYFAVTAGQTDSVTKTPYMLRRRIRGITKSPVDALRAYEETNQIYRLRKARAEKLIRQLTETPPPAEDEKKPGKRSKIG